MQISRRGSIATVGSLLFTAAGCLAESNDAPDAFPVDDISVHNDRDEAVEVTVSVTRGSESAFEETLRLDPDETKTYEDVVENGREYEITVSADGLTKTVPFEERRDNAGVEFSIGPEKIESVEIVH